MNRIVLVDSGWSVQDVYWKLQQHPEFWNEYTLRTQSPDSPHRETDDIWVRFAPQGVDGGKDHDAVWYPSADILGVKPLVHALMQRMQGTRLGGVLITRIPAGKQVFPHTDYGWHAEYYQKFAVQLTSAPGQKFCFEGEELETKPGDLFWFDNSHSHWVTNPTPYDRVTMIVCIRKEG